MNKSVLDTQFAQMYQLEPLIKNAYTWLITDAKLDTTQDKYFAIVNNISPIIKTPISECFNSIKDEGVLKQIYFISTLMSKSISVPELLTINDISIYGKTLPYVKQKDLLKSWINISSMLSPPSKSRYADLTVSSANDLMSSVVRACLCMSYTDSKTWLNPKLAAFVIEVYVMMMRSVVDRLYRLDLEESSIIKYAFAYYYAYLLDNTLDKDGVPVLLQKSSLLFKANKESIEDLNETMLTILNGEQITMNHVVKFIVENGPSRVRTLNKDMLYRATSISSLNNVATWIAIDYPPYLVYLLFLSMSGNKHPIINNLVNNVFDTKYVKQNVEQLLKYKNLYNGVVNV